MLTLSSHAALSIIKMFPKLYEPYGVLKYVMEKVKYVFSYVQSKGMNKYMHLGNNTMQLQV